MTRKEALELGVVAGALDFARYAPAWHQYLDRLDRALALMLGDVS